MKRLCLVLLLLAAPILPSTPLFPSDARAGTGDASAKDAFEAAKELNTKEGWEAFLASYPSGFYANLARAYVKKLGGAAPATAEQPAAEPAPAPAAKTQAAPSPAPDTTVAATVPGQPAVARGAKFMGFPEQFNRYYTDPAWKPATTVYVSPDGSGDGTTRDDADVGRSRGRSGAARHDDLFHARQLSGLL